MNILEEADGIINGERNSDYGTPLDNHTCTADMWRAYLERRFGAIIELIAEDVCMMNSLQKISRWANKEKRDHLVDIAGYSGNAEMCQDERARRQRLYTDAVGVDGCKATVSHVSPVSDPKQEP